jgi:hypothetical protein
VFRSVPDGQQPVFKGVDVNPFSKFLIALLMLVTGVAGVSTQAPANTDVYHVHFTKAVPGQAAALGADLVKQNATAAMPGHFVMLRHQEGDDWDYCVIEHVGTSATVKVTPGPAPGTPPLSAWHSDTYVSGPAWPEFSRAMGVAGNAAQTAASVYVVSVFRAAPGHRTQLIDLLNRPPTSKVPQSQVLLSHLEGDSWGFLTLTRYNSWQDFGADRQASSSDASGWAETRQHVAFHTDTIADRAAPR